MQSRIFAPCLGSSQKTRDVRIFFYYFFQGELLFRWAVAVWVSAGVGRGLSGAGPDVGRGLSGVGVGVGCGLSGAGADAGCQS